MFRVIRPHQHRFYRARIDLLVGLMRPHSSMLLRSEELSQATFIIAAQGAGDVYGGAILHKMSLNDRQFAIQNISSAVSSSQNDLWEAIPFLLEEHAVIAFSADKEKAIETFYCGLLENIAKFGIEERVESFCLSLSHSAYTCLNRLKRMKKKCDFYRLEFDPQTSENGIFRGVLSIREHRYKASKFSYCCLNLSSASMKGGAI